ncbi:MAG: PAS domain-containing protein [Deltaproteobacteria bacterium]|nr:PAS domain-containing protein [Deltaproteobacteria bacterium]
MNERRDEGPGPSRPGESGGHDQLARAILDDLPIGVWVARAPSGELLFANRTFGEIMGMAARDDVRVGEYGSPYGIRTRDGSAYPEQRMPFVQALQARRLVTLDDIVIHRHDGGRVNVRAHARPVLDGRGEPTHVIVAFEDITREVQAERGREEADARLRHAEMQRSIGQLAGGIAHDFNNVLSSIRVLVHRLRMHESDVERLLLLDDVDAAATSGASLARQLLDLSGGTLSPPAVLELREVVSSVTRILSRTLGSGIVVVTDDDGSAVRVLADRSQLEQVVLNLALNARDAMPEGGHLRVSTSRSRLEPAAAARLGVAASDVAILEVRDSGGGIAPDVRERIFEPYFTTRRGEGEEGRGLGLATVLAIVTRHGGAVVVEDVVPRGTCMRVVLPAAD